MKTKKIGKILAKNILKARPQKAVVIALEGELGGGKTTFLQGFAKGLGIKEKILSPTFVIMKKFGIRNPKSQTISKSQFLKSKTFYHIDCYRVQRSKEILDLGFREIISDPKNIIAVEWADRIKKLLPGNAIFLKFKFVNKFKREVALRSNER